MPEILVGERDLAKSTFLKMHTHTHTPRMNRARALKPRRREGAGVGRTIALINVAASHTHCLRGSVEEPQSLAY